MNFFKQISYSDPLEIDESPKQALESVCDVQTPEVVVDSEDSKVKEESIVSATTEYTDENNGEKEHEVIANETSSTEVRKFSRFLMLMHIDISLYHEHLCCHMESKTICIILVYFLQNRI